MQKAIRLEVILWIEGEDEPAHDWTKLTTKAVREIIAEGAKTHPELAVEVRSVRERS
jgi:hypothetical protein